VSDPHPRRSFQARRSRPATNLMGANDAWTDWRAADCCCRRRGPALVSDADLFPSAGPRRVASHARPNKCPSTGHTDTCFGLPPSPQAKPVCVLAMPTPCGRSVGRVGSRRIVPVALAARPNEWSGRKCKTPPLMKTQRPFLLACRCALESRHSSLAANDWRRRPATPSKFVKHDCSFAGPASSSSSGQPRPA
jgi:hypothetical protein